jgi:hypothetical protein
MKFSDRIGITKQKNVIQRHGIDDTLKNKLWNVFYTYLILPLHNNNSALLVNTEHYRFFVNLWHNYFENPVDLIPEDKISAIADLRSYFFQCKWFDVYNFLEFVSAKNELFDNNKFKDSINIVLEIELSAYRFIGDEIVLVETGEKLKGTDNTESKAVLEPNLSDAKNETEVRKTVTTDFMLSAIEPFNIDDQQIFIPEEKKNDTSEIIETTKAVKDKLGLRSEDRDAFLTIKSKPARTTVGTKAGKESSDKANSTEIISGQPNQASHRDKPIGNSKEESSEKQDELDKAIQILRQKNDTKLNISDL